MDDVYNSNPRISEGVPSFSEVGMLGGKERNQEDTVQELVFGPACSFPLFLHLPLFQRCKEVMLFLDFLMNF